MPKTAIQLDDQTVVADVLAGSPKTRLPDTAWQTMGALDPRGVDVFQWGFQTLGIGELSQHGSGASCQHSGPGQGLEGVGRSARGVDAAAQPTPSPLAQQPPNHGVTEESVHLLPGQHPCLEIGELREFLGQEVA